MVLTEETDWICPHYHLRCNSNTGHACYGWMQSYNDSIHAPLECSTVMMMMPLHSGIEMICTRYIVSSHHGTTIGVLSIFMDSNLRTHKQPMETRTSMHVHASLWTQVRMQHWYREKLSGLVYDLRVLASSPLSMSLYKHLTLFIKCSLLLNHMFRPKKVIIRFSNCTESIAHRRCK